MGSGEQFRSYTRGIPEVLKRIDSTKKHTWTEIRFDITLCEEFVTNIRGILKKI